jgi:putative transcriptional regulator
MKTQYDSIMEGLGELLEYAKGDTAKARSRIVEAPDIKISPPRNYSKEEIKKIRLNNKLTIKTFASCMGVNRKTVESWESGANVPSGASLRLLQILDKKPNALRELEIISGAM